MSEGIEELMIFPTAKGVCRQQGYRRSLYIYIYTHLYINTHIRRSEGACSSRGCRSPASAEPNPAPTGVPWQIALPSDGARGFFKQVLPTSGGFGGCLCGNGSCFPNRNSRRKTTNEVDTQKKKIPVVTESSTRGFSWNREGFAPFRCL